MIKTGYLLIFVLTVALSQNQSAFAFANKLPNNQVKTFQNADDFYNNVVDKQRYEEYNDAKLNVRSLTTIKKLPKVIDGMSWDYDADYRHPIKEDFIKYSKRFDPEQKVYYFFTLKDSGEQVFYQNAMYDLKTKELIYASKGNWVKDK
ncbi:hypothetical protein B4102_3327 [Heyndrickxia sporothermodurans]|uniref:Uncharacterized protein n=1 Tax=Heyndrickxia sporothermodurans TaxID=46224 RepID=A0A150KVI4_9BACI|nr:hypothetical protein [Heyndrickxia sporothermodurans]KYD04107.1 hypothetical protein B4102_3327 [Heyndrickxia sporothermodurans]